MGYVFLGHGDLDLKPGAIPAGMEHVAIPQGTTIQFYADTGQGLIYGSDQLDAWSQLQAPWAPLDSTNVTYNLELSSAPELWDDELANDPDFGGHTLIRAGVDGVPDPLLICTGTPETCPTDPRKVASGATHTCDGILGTYTGELFWLACTSLHRASTQQEGIVQAAMGDAPADVMIGASPDDAIANALALLQAAGEEGFGELFDDMPEAEQQLVLTDPTIAAWHAARTD